MIKHTTTSLFILFALLVVTGCSERSSEDAREQQKVAVSGAEEHYPVKIIALEATLTKVTGDYTFDTAGSPLYMDGRLYFTNNNFDRPELSRTLRQNQDGSIDTLAMDNGVATTLQASGKGTIYACQMLGHKVVELDNNGQVMNVVASEYNGRRIDGPNDIVVDQKGGLYFSDSQFIAGGQKMQETSAVYYVNKEGELSRVIDDISFPNGMTLSPDGRTLYVANTQGAHLLAYDVRKDGSVHNKRSFGALKLAEDEEESGADGMAMDTEGNVYVATTKGLGVQVFNPQGKYLGNIETPTPSNNVSFGGKNNQIMYIAAQDGIYSIPVKIKGV